MQTSLTKNDLISMLKNAMNCNIIALKNGVSHVKINWLLRKYDINIKEIQKELPKYYVYIHKYNDKVFYVGSAQGDSRRMWSLNKRSKEWSDFVNSINYDYDAEIIEICNNKKDSHSREHYWGGHFKSIGQAHLWKEDTMLKYNPNKNKDVLLKAIDSKKKNKEIKDRHFAEKYIEIHEKQEIRNTGRNRKIVLQVLENGDVFDKYESIAKASNVLGISASSISRACKNGNKCKGFYWMFEDTE